MKRLIINTSNNKTAFILFYKNLIIKKMIKSFVYNKQIYIKELDVNITFLKWYLSKKQKVVNVILRHRKLHDVSCDFQLLINNIKTNENYFNAVNLSQIFQILILNVNFESQFWISIL